MVCRHRGFKISLVCFLAGEPFFFPPDEIQHTLLRLPVSPAGKKDPLWLKCGSSPGWPAQWPLLPLLQHLDAAWEARGHDLRTTADSTGVFFITPQATFVWGCESRP